MFKKWKELPKNALACSFGHLSFGQLSVGNYSGDHFERNPENFAISKKKSICDTYGVIRECMLLKYLERQNICTFSCCVRHF